MDTARLSKMSVPKTIFVSEPDRDLGEVRLGGTSARRADSRRSCGGRAIIARRSALENMENTPSRRRRRLRNVDAVLRGEHEVVGDERARAGRRHVVAADVTVGQIYPQRDGAAG